MGIETIIIVFGIVIVIAIGVGVSRAKRRAAGTQAPRSDAPSSVQKKP
jgi:hypothetical protein